MNIIHTQYDRITVVDHEGWIDFANPPDPDMVILTRRRDLVLTPRDYQGHTVMAAYDRPSDTLFVRVPNEGFF